MVLRDDGYSWEGVSHKGGRTEPSSVLTELVIKVKLSQAYNYATPSHRVSLVKLGGNVYVSYTWMGCNLEP